LASSGGEAHDGETTASLLRRVRDGDASARDGLIRRYLPALRRWARGRLPGGARHLADTDDLVQVTLLRALDKVQEFEHRGEGSFLAYLRRILKNEICDQMRRAARRPAGEPMSETLTVNEQSPLEAVIGQETLERYEAALARLPDDQQEAVMLRIELGFSWSEVAEATGSPTPNAARMAVTRAIARLAEEMDAGR
jgi:RNA polymerase sigma-70 factor (ECF subfamily)